jgi:hypothetical protein
MKNKKRKNHKKQPNPVGRPPLYNSPKELQTAIDEYFKTEAYVDLGLVKNKKGKSTRVQRYVPTITGLVVFLGFSSRDTFYEYEKKPEFTDTIKKARTRIEQAYERLLHGANCTGAIFALKNFGWQDKTEHELSGEIKFVQMPAIKRAGKKQEFNVG